MTNDWLDELMRRESAEPADDGFSAVVLHALPPPVMRRPAGRAMRWVNVAALIAGTLLVLGLLPQTIDVLVGPASAPHGEWDLALPTFTLLGWLAWWSWHQACLAD